MGSRVAPPLAVVFMGMVGHLILATPRAQPALYLRYIDDVFGVWSHGAVELNAYLEFINTAHPSIKFTAERSDVSEGRLAFLDTEVTVQPNGEYRTELYYKPMAAPIIMPYDSAHPVRVKRAVLSSQLSRAVRLASDITARDRGIAKVTSLFQANGYPARLITGITNQVLNANAGSQETNRNRNNRGGREDRTFMTLPFIDDKLSRKIEGAIRSSNLEFSVAWKNQKSLRNVLVRSALDPPPCPGGGRKCATCAGGLRGKCHTTNVVYEISCELCARQNHRNTYIGETRRSVRLRFNEHLRDARHKTPDTPLGDHMSSDHPEIQPNTETFKIDILRVCEDGPNRKVTESLFIRDRNPSLNVQTTSWPILHL